MQKKIATAITWIFSPLLIPTYITLLLLYGGFYFLILPRKAEYMLIILMIAITFVMPAITLAIIQFGKNRKSSGVVSFDREIALIFIAVYFLLGTFLFGRNIYYWMFRTLLFSGAVSVILYMLIALKWKISIHMAALGGALGAIFALSFRLRINALWWLSAVVLISGITGTSLMINEKQTLMGVATGFALGCLISSTLFFL